MASKKKRSAEKLAHARGLLECDNPDYRRAALALLDDHGERGDLPEVERRALFDTEIFSIEGAFVDPVVMVADFAVQALCSIAGRSLLLEADRARLRGYLAKGTGDAQRLAAVFKAWGPRARGIVEGAAGDADAKVQELARRVLDGLDR